MKDTKEYTEFIKKHQLPLDMLNTRSFSKKGFIPKETNSFYSKNSRSNWNFFTVPIKKIV